MIYKIDVKNVAHKRWIKFGLLTHNNLKSDKENITGFSKISKCVTTNINYFDNYSHKKDYETSFVSLDAASFLGRTYTNTLEIIDRKKFKCIYIVGDLGAKNIPFFDFDNLSLLYDQSKNNSFSTLNKIFHDIKFFEGMKSGIFPSALYFLKDVTSHPLEVKKLIFNTDFDKKKYIFAGQNGTHSIYNIFDQHECLESIQKTNRIKISEILNEYINDISKDTSSLDISEIIINITNQLIEILENTTFALEQTNFRKYRETIIFKSVFRLCIIRLLDELGVLELIKYPDKYIRIYNSSYYEQYIHIDFGGVNGYEKLYPRVADIIFNKLSYHQLNQDDLKRCQASLEIKNLKRYIDCELALLLNKRK